MVTYVACNVFKANFLFVNLMVQVAMFVNFQPTSGALYSEDDFVIMTTTEKEKYKCLLPSLTAGEEVSRINHF